MKNVPLMMSLKARGLSVNKLAGLVGVSHCRVSQTLNNVPHRGYLTRPKLAKLLTAEELTLVGWDENGKQLHQGNEANQEQHKPVEQSSTRNNQGVGAATPYQTTEKI